MQSGCRLSLRKNQARMTIPWHHGRRFKGGLTRVAHEQGPTYAKVQPRPGSSIIPSLPASAWLCQDVQSLTLTWETNEEKLKVVPYSACLPGGAVNLLDFLILLLSQSTPALRGITNTQTFPRAIFHSLIDNFSVGFLSPAYFSKCQARNSLSHLRLKIFSPFLKSDKELICEVEGIISLQLYSVFTVIKATRVDIVTPSTVC